MLPKPTCQQYPHYFAMILGFILFLGLCEPVLASSEPEFKKTVLSHAIVYTVKIPTPASNKHLILFPWVSAGLQPVDKVASGLMQSKFIKPIAVLNAGFFDPKSTQTISYVVKNGQILSDPSQNPGLMGNTNIQPFLNQVLNRSRFAQLYCRGGIQRFKVLKQFDPIPKDCFVNNSIQAGPDLFNTNAPLDEAFVAYDDTGKVTRDPIGFRWRNARSAIGVTAKGEVILAMISMITRGVDNGKDDKPEPSGMSIAEVGAYLKQLGVVEAVALDGGSSSSLWFNGQSFFGKLDKSVKPIRRSVKSVWVLGEKKHQ